MFRERCKVERASQLNLAPFAVLVKGGDLHWLALSKVIDIFGSRFCVVRPRIKRLAAVHMKITKRRLLQRVKVCTRLAIFALLHERWLASVGGSLSFCGGAAIGRVGRPRLAAPRQRNAE